MDKWHLFLECNCVFGPCYTVEPRYVELGYPELPALSNRIGFPLDLPLFFQSFTMGYLELGYLEHPAISNCFSLSLVQIDPGYFELYYVSKKHWQTSVRKCSQGTSWQNVLKDNKCIDVFMVMKGKSDWLDLLLRVQKATSCRYSLILGIKLLLQKFDTNLAISNYFSIPLRVRDSGVLLQLSFRQNVFCCRGWESFSFCSITVSQ